MRLESGKSYLTRCGLTVLLIEKINDPRDRYPFIGEYRNGADKGNRDFWMRDGIFLEFNEHQMDLVAECN